MALPMFRGYTLGEHSFGISTCWWHGNKRDLRDLARDVRNLGLNGVELEYRISRNDMRVIIPMLKQHEIHVLSIHNFFPKPEGIEKGSGDLFLLSSVDKDERKRAVRYSLETLRIAHEVGAQAVVLHLGRVDMPNPFGELARLYKERETRSRDLRQLVDSLKLSRKSIAAKHLESVLLSLDVLAKEADRLGILLGIENRYYIHEIPNLEEIGVILEKFRGGPVLYWHDVGHARVQENLGITKEAELLSHFGRQMVGLHIHDVHGLEDHLAPGQGKVDYTYLRPYWGEVDLKIFEVHPKVQFEDLRKGVRALLHNNGSRIAFP